MNKILVVGGAGYVGGYLTDLLIKYDHEVTVYDNLLYERDFLKDVPFIYGDVRDRDLLEDILPAFNTVIWLAAVVGDGACARDPYVAQSINEDSVKWLVDNFNKKIVFMSTCSVYGANQKLLIEDALTNPLSVYAKTKLAAERYLMENASVMPLVFRLGTLFGLGDRYSRIRLDLVVNVLTKNAALDIPLKVYGGDQWRPLLHVKDVARAVVYCLDNNISGLYNLSSENITIKDLARSILEIIPYAKVEYQEQLTEDTRNYKVDCSRIKSKGWQHQYTLTYGIKEIYDVIKDRRLKNVDDEVYSNEHYLSNQFRSI